MRLGAGRVKEPSSAGPARQEEWSVSPQLRKPVETAAWPAEVATEERRSWVRNGLAALTVSALGLAVGSSLPLTTSAHTTANARVLTSPRVSAAGKATQKPGAGQADSAANADPALRPFRPNAKPPPTSDDRVRAAVVKERTIQRAEDLSKTAEDATRVTRNANSQVREAQLKASDRAAREKAVRIAAERRQRALAVRLKVEDDRRAAEVAAAAVEQAAADRAADQAASDQAAARATTAIPPPVNQPRRPAPPPAGEATAPRRP